MRRSGVPLGYVTAVTFSSVNTSSIFCRTLGYQPHIVGDDLNNVAQPTRDTSEVPNSAVVTP
jgi:hypothetical protein